MQTIEEVSPVISTPRYPHSNDEVMADRKKNYRKFDHNQITLELVRAP